jgi:hypothetical protein
MTHAETLPALNKGDDPEKVLTWTYPGYDSVTKTFPAQHFFLNCVSAKDRVKAEQAPRHHPLTSHTQACLAQEQLHRVHLQHHPLRVTTS